LIKSCEFFESTARGYRERVCCKEITAVESWIGIWRLATRLQARIITPRALLRRIFQLGLVLLQDLFEIRAVVSDISIFVCAKSEVIYIRCVLDQRSEAIYAILTEFVD
jgi:hypothetical protein